MTENTNNGNGVYDPRSDLTTVLRRYLRATIGAKSSEEVPELGIAAIHDISQVVTDALNGQHNGENNGRNNGENYQYLGNEDTVLMNPGARKLYIDHQEIKSPGIKEFDLILLLMKGHNEVIEKNEIAEALWPYANHDGVSDDAIY